MSYKRSPSRSKTFSTSSLKLAEGVVNGLSGAVRVGIRSAGVIKGVNRTGTRGFMKEICISMHVSAISKISRFPTVVVSSSSDFLPLAFLGSAMESSFFFSRS
jgi:hypothetical protein